MKSESESAVGKFKDQFYSNLPALGIIVALIYPCIDIVMELLRKDLALNFGNISLIYKSSPSPWLIAFACLVFCTLFYLAKQQLQFLKERHQNQDQMNNVQWSLLGDFVSALNNGNLNTSLSKEFKNQKITALLADYKEKLANEKIEEEKRHWENNGLTRFGELLRTYTDLDKVSDEVIKFAVSYTKSNQGSVYLIKSGDDDSPLLELKASYAYSRKKYISSVLQPGEGLVGQCYLEKETILLRKVPADYIKITSGLGEAIPTSVVLIPLKYDGKVQGVMELASFTEYDQYTIDFLEAMGAAFGSITHTLNNNDYVKKLLTSSQEQTQQLLSQEEEMRQNLEEIQATQEQLARQLQENTLVKGHLQVRENVLGLTTILSESDLYGTITFVNSKFCEVSQYSPEELLGKGHNLLRHPDMPAEVFKLMWATIKKGKTFTGIVKNRKKDGSHYWVDATIVPVKDDEGKIVKYIGARYHIQNETLAQAMYNQQMQQLENSSKTIDSVLKDYQEELYLRN